MSCFHAFTSLLTLVYACFQAHRPAAAADTVEGAHPAEGLHIVEQLNILEEEAGGAAATEDSAALYEVLSRHDAYYMYVQPVMPWRSPCCLDTPMQHSTSSAAYALSSHDEVVEHVSGS